VKIAAFLLFIIFINSTCFGYQIDLEKIKLSSDILLQVSISLCVTEDNLFLVVDFKGGDVKIYKSSGELVGILGSKGFGPNEFAQPLFCHYSDKKFVISDNGQRKIFIYDRKDKLKFIRSKEIFANSVGNDHYLKNNTIYIAGYKTPIDGINYQFYALNFEKNDQYTYYLPGYLKYGLNSEEDLKKELFRKPDISAIGGLAYFDIHGDFAYYIWGGDLKIFKINLKTKAMKTFGEKTSNYIKPYASKRLLNSFGRGTIQSANITGTERKKMSYVRQIFTTKKHVLVNEKLYHRCLNCCYIGAFKFDL
jgi:hypothetical protein